MRLYLVLAAAIASLLGVSHWGAYDYGKHVERDAVARAVARHQAREAELLEQLTAERTRTHIKYVDRIKVVKEAADPTRCIDTTLPPTLIQSLKKEQRP